MKTEQINHGLASRLCKLVISSLAPHQLERGYLMVLGTENHDLPSFVVMISQGRGQMQALFSHLWGTVSCQENIRGFNSVLRETLCFILAIHKEWLVKIVGRPWT